MLHRDAENPEKWIPVYSGLLSSSYNARMAQVCMCMCVLVFVVQTGKFITSFLSF